MDFTAVLLATVLLVQGMGVSVWWVGGNWLGLSRRATRHWLLAGTAYGAALVALLLQELLAQRLSLLVVHVLVVHGVISMRRGLQGFLRLRHTDTTHVSLGLGVLVFNLGVCLPLGLEALGSSVSGLLIAFLLACTAIEIHRTLSRDYGEAFARGHSGILGVAALSFVATVLVQWLPAWHQAWQRIAPPHQLVGMVYLYLLLSIGTTFTGGYMVVRRLVKKLEHLSHHDSLTGLFNRRAIEYLLSREVQRLQRFGEPFSVLMVDIDHFKRINDRLGHAAGDAVLCAVAQALTAHAREVDRVARFGGEEFCVLLPHTLHEGAMQAAERLREAINQIGVVWNDEVVSVTISTGMATAEDPLETPEAVVRRADKALYHAKAEGRNRVVSARLMIVA